MTRNLTPTFYLLPPLHPQKRLLFSFQNLGFFFYLIFLSQELNEKLSCNRVEIIRDPSPLSPKESPDWSGWSGREMGGVGNF